MKTLLTTAFASALTLTALAHADDTKLFPAVLVWAAETHHSVIAQDPQKFACVAQMRPGRAATPAVEADPELGIKARKGRDAVEPKMGYRCFLPTYAPALRAALNLAGK